MASSTHGWCEWSKNARVCLDELIDMIRTRMPSNILYRRRDGKYCTLSDDGCCRGGRLQPSYIFRTKILSSIIAIQCSFLPASVLFLKTKVATIHVLMSSTAIASVLQPTSTWSWVFFLMNDSLRYLLSASLSVRTKQEKKYLVCDWCIDGARV